MKKRILLFALLAIAASLPMQAQRYLSEIFTSVTKFSNVVYGANITVITGQPSLDTLVMDVYVPMNDTMQARPVVFVAHTGSFLPVPINGQCTGDKSDYAVEQTCDQLARRGFVAVAFNYRLGWNPIGDQDARTGTLLNAAYRGIQDARAAARYLRMDAAGPNTYSIHPDRFVIGGYGTGGYISLGAGYLDSFDELYLSKFINTTTFNSYVDTSLSGDPYGIWNRPLNIANNPSYDSEFQMVWNAGGAVGDSSWIEAGEPPVAALHVPSDPYAPYDYGAVIVPTTQQFVVFVSGSEGVVRQANAVGINASINTGIYSDPVSVAAAAAANGGDEALFPFNLTGQQAGPWEFWDTTCVNSSNGFITNPDMSMTKADNYIDSTVAFLAPRIVCALGLPGCNTTGIKDVLAVGAVNVFPNPSTGIVNIRSEVKGSTISSLRLLDLNGRAVRTISGLKVVEFSMDNQGLAPGMYLLNVQTTKGAITKKIVIE